MIVEKDGYVAICNIHGDLTLYDFLGQRIFKGSFTDLTKDKIYKMIDEFSKKGILAYC